MAEQVARRELKRRLDDDAEDDDMDGEGGARVAWVRFG